MLWLRSSYVPGSRILSSGKFFCFGSVRFVWAFCLSLLQEGVVQGRLYVGCRPLFWGDGCCTKFLRC